MSNIEYFAKMLGYHTKGREAVLREGTDLKNDKNHNGINDKDEKESKDNTVKKINKMAEGSHCDCEDDCKCDDKVEEARGEWSKDSGWKKPDTDKKDQYGNKIKNVAKSLAKSAAKDSAKMTKEGSELEEKRGLWDNIHAKRERIKNGSGERMRKPGEEGAPSAKDLKNSRNEEFEIEEGALAGHIRTVRGWIKDGKTREQSHELAKQRGMHPKIVDDHYDNIKEEVYIDHFVDVMEAMAEFEDMFEEADLSLAEAIEEWFSDEDLEENFQKMTKTKRLIAAKKAALTKRKTGNWGGGRPSKAPKAARNIQKRRIRIKRG